MLWSLATFLGEGICLGCGLAPHFQFLSIDKCHFLFLLTVLASDLGPFAGRAPAVGRLWGKVWHWWGLWFNQLVCQLVNKSLFISAGEEQPIGWLGHMVSLSAVFPPHTILHTRVPWLTLRYYPDWLNPCSNTFGDWLPTPSRNHLLCLVFWGCSILAHL